MTRIGADAAVNARALLEQFPLVIEDARRDARAATHPLMSSPEAGGDEFRFYAGVPLLASDGGAIGTLCVLATEPRTIDADGLATLEDLAAMVIRELEVRVDAADS